MISGKTIFISPLDWGLGHATRCVSLIRELEKSNTVIIGVTCLNAAFFNLHFPGLPKAELPSYKISYSKKIPVWLKLICQWPKINSIIKEENERLKKIVTHYKIDLVISDNRFGLTHKETECVFVTHQLHLKTPFFSSIANKINRKYIHRFNQVWVPDYEEPSRRLAGQLSDRGGIKIPVKYIGPRSALTDLPSDKNNGEEKSDYLILLSGVEPQRSILEKMLIGKFERSPKKVVLVRGSDISLAIQSKNITVVNFAFGEKLKALLDNSDTVICRSGYSTLMDLRVLDKHRMILIPTPGQTEQEYLAAHWKKEFGAEELLQDAIKFYTFR